MILDYIRVVHTIDTLVPDALAIADIITSTRNCIVQLYGGSMSEKQPCLKLDHLPSVLLNVQPKNIESTDMLTAVCAVCCFVSKPHLSDGCGVDTLILLLHPSLEQPFVYEALHEQQAHHVLLR